MNKVKFNAVRGALVNLDLNTINDWTEKYNLQDKSLNDLANYLIDNGDTGLSVDFTDMLINRFVKFIDNHTTLLLPLIKEYVDKSDEDFLTQDWEVIFNNIFPNVQWYDQVVYCVGDETSTKNSDRITTETLFVKYESAKREFDNKKEILVDMLGAKNWEIETNDDDEFEMQDNHWEQYLQVYIIKKPIND